MKKTQLMMVAVTIVFTVGILAHAQRNGNGSGSGSNNNPVVPPTNQPAIRLGSPTMGPMGIPMPGDETRTGTNPLDSRLAEQQMRSRNAERQKRIESDTEKLVGLANSLKAKMQDGNTMSPADVGKQAEEIEKLARSVKDKMKG